MRANLKFAMSPNFVFDFQDECEESSGLVVGRQGEPGDGRRPRTAGQAGGAPVDAGRAHGQAEGGAGNPPPLVPKLTNK